MVRLICPNLKCRTILSAPEQARGKMVRCSACGMKVRIPGASPAPADGQAGGTQPQGASAGPK